LKEPLAFVWKARYNFLSNRAPQIMKSQQPFGTGRRRVGTPWRVLSDLTRKSKALALDAAADLRHGLRLLRLNPVFAGVAVFSLALGVGANTAIFQLLDAVRLQTLPVQRPEGLVQIRFTDQDWKPILFRGDFQQITYPQWEGIRDHQQAFTQVTALGGYLVNLARGGEARYAQALWVSGQFFDLLEVQPSLGRLLNGSDDHPGCGSPNAVISYAFWQREFGGDPTILGKKLVISDVPFEIVGVTPARFFGPEVGRFYDLALPICSQAAMVQDSAVSRRDLSWLALIGRLKPGWTLERASAHLAALSPELLKATAPSGYAQREVERYLRLRLGAFSLGSGFSRLRTRYEQPLWVLLAVAGAVLLIACANLANLMLARAGARQREIGVRLAIGASRGRLIRQLLTESLLLAALGCALGWLLALGLSRALVSLLNAFGTRGLSYFLTLQLDWRMWFFTMGTAGLTCVLFGLAPALRATRVSPATLLVSGRALAPGRQRFGLRRMLVSVQVALCFALMVCAALFSRSLNNLLNLNAGFRQEGLLYATLDLRPLRLPVNRLQEFKRDLLNRVREIPGVAAAADSFVIPVGGNYWRLGLRAGGGEPRKSVFNWVTPGFFHTMEIPLLAGRDFDTGDAATAPKVVIVNEAFRRQFFQDADPIGQTFESMAEPDYPQTIYRVVGLVKNAKYQDIREDFQPVVYAPELQHPTPFAFEIVMVRSSAPPASLVASVKEAVAGVHPAIGMDFEMIRSMVLRGMVRERLMASLSGVFGLLAVILATVGLYGVVAYMVVRRTREIGIRMALGAEPPRIVRMVLKEAITLLAIGLAAGLVLAWFAVGYAGKLLYGLPPRDPASFGAAAVILTLAALAAAFVPALRASRLHPMAALREE
jgi:putative ABC transport system permease protein